MQEIIIEPITSGFAVAAHVHNLIPEFVASGDRRTPEIFSKRVEGKRTQVLVAKVGERYAGYMVSYDRGDNGIYCWMAGVVPEYRNRGILTRMMDMLDLWALEKGFKVMYIKVKAGNDKMLRYVQSEKAGFSMINDASEKARLGIEAHEVGFFKSLVS
jgi:ribosomal protein S18 acetylase RimI-like enzyme